jgi:ribonuclease Z
MAELLLLGTGASLSDGSREPTMLAVCGARTTVLIDCGGNPVRQLQQLQVPLESIDRLILTHSHPDHMSGFPLLMEMLWLTGRNQPLPLHGPTETVALAQRVFSQWDTSQWAGLFALEPRPVKLEPNQLVARTPEFEITAAPGVHSLPVIGLRIHDLQGDGTLAYSADGEPSDGVRELARGVDVLVHEATGNYAGHSTAQGAGRLAREAGARRLVLVHLAPQNYALEAWRQQAAEAFGGEVAIGRDLDQYTF